MRVLNVKHGIVAGLFQCLPEIEVERCIVAAGQHHETHDILANLIHHFAQRHEIAGALAHAAGGQGDELDQRHMKQIALAGKGLDNGSVRKRPVYLQAHNSNLDAAVTHGIDYVSELIRQRAYGYRDTICIVTSVLLDKGGAASAELLAELTVNICIDIKCRRNNRIIIHCFIITKK